MSDSKTVSLTSVLSRSADLVWSEIDGEVSMLHIESGRYFGLRSTGVAIWRHLEHPIPVETLCDRLVTEYRVDRARCEQDVLQFTRQLVAEGLLTIDAGTVADRDA